MQFTARTRRINGSDISVIEETVESVSESPIAPGYFSPEK
jgi:hypothetical protein